VENVDKHHCRVIIKSKTIIEKLKGVAFLDTQYISFIVIIVVLFILLRNRKLAAVKKVIEKRKTGCKTEMIELAKRFIGKECLLYSFDGNHQFSGTIKEVVDSAALVENNGTVEAINLDFVIRIREYPRNKKGKKKSIVVD